MSASVFDRCDNFYDANQTISVIINGKNANKLSFYERLPGEDQKVQVDAVTITDPILNIQVRDANYNILYAAESARSLRNDWVADQVVNRPPGSIIVRDIYDKLLEPSSSAKNKVVVQKALDRKFITMSGLKDFSAIYTKGTNPNNIFFSLTSEGRLKAINLGYLPTGIYKINFVLEKDGSLKHRSFIFEVK